MFCARSSSSLLILASSSRPSGVACLLASSPLSSSVIEARSARICCSCSWLITTWLYCVCGAAFVFHPKIRLDELARSRSCDVLDTSRGGFSAAFVAALAAVSIRPVLVAPSSCLCDAISTSPGFDCNSIVFGPPVRFGRFQLSLRAQESTVFSLSPSLRAASRAPSSIARTRTASRSTGGLLCGFVVFFCMVVTPLLYVASCFIQSQKPLRPGAVEVYHGTRSDFSVTQAFSD